jgi:hypothetical protein
MQTRIISRCLIAVLCSFAIPVLLNAQGNKPENDVNVVNTPSVNVVNTPSVSVTNTPSVNVANTPTVNIGNSVGTSVLPNRPFTRSAGNGPGYRSVGPGSSGTLGVTSITFTNSTGTLEQVFVFTPIFQSGSVCGSTNVIGGSNPRFYVVVPAYQTVHLTYPSPMVFSAVNGQSCVAFSGGDTLDITVNGFVN